MALDAQHRAAPRRARAPHAAGRLLRRLHEEPRCEPGEFVQAIEVPPLPRRRARCAPTRSASASTATSRRCAPASRSSSTASTRARRAPRLRRHGGDRQARRAAPRPRCVGQPWTEASAATPRMAALAAGLQAADRPARQRRLPAAGGAATCCSASGWRRAPTSRCRRARLSVFSDADGRSAGGTPMNKPDVEPAAPARAAAPTPRAAQPPAPRRHQPRRTNRRTCTWPARRPTSTTCPSSPARCTPRSACRRWRTAGSRGIDLDALRALPGVVAVLTAADIPGANDCGPIVHDDPILARRRRLQLPRPAGVRGDRRRRATPRAAPPRRRKEVLTIEPLPAVLTPQRGARQRPVRAAADAPGARRRRRARRDRRRAAPAAGHASTSAARSSSTSKARSRYAMPREDDGMLRALLDPAPERDAAPGRACAAAARAPRCRSSAGAWAAASAARSRSRRCSPASPRWPRAQLKPPGQAAPGPRRRLPDHRPAPLLRVRVRGRLRRRRPHPRRRGRRWSRAPATRPTCPAR